MTKHEHSLSTCAILCFCWATLLLSCCDGLPAKNLNILRKSPKCHQQFSNRRFVSLLAQADQSDIPFFDKLLKSIGMTSMAARSSKVGVKQSPKLQKSVRRLPRRKVIIIGTGLSGLAAAKELTKAGCNDFLMIDSADGPGGRVRTDVVDGYLLDRGFQVFIDSYPEAKLLFDGSFNELNLKPFLPGALVYYNNAFHVVSDPFRRPQDLYASIISPIGSFVDKAKVGIYSVLIKFRAEADFFKREELTTLQHLSQREGLSPLMIDRFFKPFFQGIFLSPLDLQSSRMFEFVFKMFTVGSATLPEYGMGRIGDVLAAKIPAEQIMLNTRVTLLESSSDTSSQNDSSLNRIYATDRLTGEQLLLESDHVIVATDPETAKALLRDGKGVGEKQVNGIADISIPDPRSSVCLYFGFDGLPPIVQPCLILNGDKESDLNTQDSGPFGVIGGGSTCVNNVCFPSQVSSAYAPEGKSLASVTIVGGGGDYSDAQLSATVKDQLRAWWGEQVDSWDLLRIYRIPYAQPAQTPPYTFSKATNVSPGVYLCGDHRGTATLNGAIESGKTAARDLLRNI